MPESEDSNPYLCKNRACRRVINTGDEVLMLQRVVIGVARPVALEEATYLHADRCFEEYINRNYEVKLPRRIP